LFDDRDCGGRQRNTVFLACLHPIGWHRPHFLSKVELAPPGANDFTGASSCQDQEFERASGYAFLLAQSSDELAQVIVGKRGMMNDLANLRPWRQQLVKMSAP